MTRMNKTVRPLLLAALLGGAFAVPAEAAVISILPSTKNVVTGDPVGIDVVLSLDANDVAVGGVSFQLVYDSSILGAPNGYQNDPANIMGLGLDPLNDASNGFTGGGSPLDVFYVADLSLNESALRLAQGAGFTLTHVDFTAAALGTSALTLTTVGDFLSDFAGGNAMSAEIRNGSVCVGVAGAVDCAVNPTPEPGTLALLAASMLGVFAGRRRSA